MPHSLCYHVRGGGGHLPPEEHIGLLLSGMSWARCMLPKGGHPGGRCNRIRVCRGHRLRGPPHQPGSCCVRAGQQEGCHSPGATKAWAADNSTLAGGKMPRLPGCVVRPECAECAASTHPCMRACASGRTCPGVSPAHRGSGLAPSAAPPSRMCPSTCVTGAAATTAPLCSATSCSAGGSTHTHSAGTQCPRGAECRGVLLVLAVHCMSGPPANCTGQY
jgi:hypothetical protein